MIWRFSGQEMTFEKIRIMGILNLTPDSFSDGGEFLSRQKAVERALQMEKEGADLIDLGGESTRPGARSISEKDEIERVLPVIYEIRSRTSIPISIDTTKPKVAEACLQAGANIINDVDGLSASFEMAHVAHRFRAGLILMHRRGTPETMQQWTQYDDLVEDVFRELDEAFDHVCEAGVEREQVVLDPGIGFSKTAEQNLEILARLDYFQGWNRPVLIGPSRKSFIGNLTHKDPADRDWGTAASVALSVKNGVQLIRVHNVSAMVDVIKVADAIKLTQSRSEDHVRS